MTIEDRVAIPALADEGPSHGHRPALPTHQASPTDGVPCHAPDLVGLPALEAHAAARTAGVRLSVSVWETRVGPWGMVIDQRPAAGSRVRRGGRLSVIVSGQPHAPIPDVRGLPLDAAIERLCWLGFVPLVKARRTSDRVPPGHIITTRPSAGTLLADGSVVALTLARPGGGDRPRSAELARATGE